MALNDINPKYHKALAKLNSIEKAIIVDKATEPPFSGTLLNVKDEGIFYCKLCHAPLFKSKDKFESFSGWPSFDDEIKGAVKKIPDADGIRIEIVCNNCGAHLGHIFYNEGFTAKNKRYCVNSLSLLFKKV